MSRDILTDPSDSLCMDVHAPRNDTPYIIQSQLIPHVKPDWSDEAGRRFRYRLPETLLHYRSTRVLRDKLKLGFPLSREGY